MLAVALTLLMGLGLLAQTPRGPNVVAFEANEGQWAEDVRFGGRLGSTRLFLDECGGATIVLSGEPRAVLRSRLRGAQPADDVRAGRPLPGVANYYVGNDPTRWRAGVRRCAEARFDGVLPGVDVVYYDRAGQLEYDLILHPGASANAIAVEFEGHDQLRLAANGDLVLATAAGEVRHLAPVAWQDIAGRRHAVDVRFLLAGADAVGFALGEFDHAHAIVIDPVVVYATMLGGFFGAQKNMRVAVDSGGNAVVVGSTTSSDFPTSAATQPALGGFGDLFVTKLTPDGTNVVFSTYLGGTANFSEEAGGVAVASDGRIAVVGQTPSVDYPVTGNAAQSQRNAITSCCLSVLSPTGSLLYSTYFGGTGNQYAHGVDFANGTNTVYVTGRVESADLPVTPGAAQSASGGSNDAFVASFDVAAGPLQNATYFGGDRFDVGYDVRVLSDGRVAIAGTTKSLTLPVTGSAFQAAHADPTGNTLDLFVAVFDGLLTQRTYATYLGGSAGDGNSISATTPLGIDVDSADHVHIASMTQSPDFPTTANALAAVAPGGFDAVVVEMDPGSNGAASLVYSTFLGGSAADEARDIVIDGQGNRFVVGATGSANFPLQHALQALLAQPGNTDAFLSVIDASGAALRLSTPIGTGLGDVAQGVDLAGNGHVVVAGAGLVQATPNAFGAGPFASAAFVVRFDVPLADSANYGNGLAGALGVPTLALSAPPVLGSAITIDAGNSAGVVTLGVLLFGTEQTAIPLFGGTVLVLNPLTLGHVIPIAGISIPLNIPSSTSFCGQEFLFQMVEFDAATVQGFSFSAGMEIELGI